MLAEKLLKEPSRRSLDSRRAEFASAAAPRRQHRAQRAKCKAQCRIYSCLLQTNDRLLISPNHLVRPRQYVGRNRQADLFGGFEIDDELKFLRLLHRQIGGALSLSSFV